MRVCFNANGFIIRHASPVPGGWFHNGSSSGHPPKKQIVVDGRLSWNLAPPNTDLRSDLVLIYVRRVRNNLFHGGKVNGHWFAPEGSEALLRHSLTVLHACLAASNELNQAYNG